MKRPRCKTCKHRMKGHRKKQCMAKKRLLIDGCTYEGSVYDNKPSGRGRLESEEFIYEGEWCNGLRHGYGRETSTSGVSYDGEWVDGKYHGQGHLKGVDNSEYRGEFFRGKFHGRGFYKNNDMSYDGEWYHGSRHGEGIFVNENGSLEPFLEPLSKLEKCPVRSRRPAIQYRFPVEDSH